MDDAKTLRAGDKVVVLGAGIAGLFAARHLVSAGYKVRVIEAGERCGGAHLSRQIGPYTFDVGSIFYEELARIFQLADGLREMCPTVERRQRRISAAGTLLHYPLNPRDILRNSGLTAIKGLINLLYSRAFVRLDGSLDAICRKRLGSHFFEQTGLHAYISRFNHCDPREIAERFFYERMAFIDNASRGREMIRAGLNTIMPSGKNGAKPRKKLRIRPYAGFDELFAPIQRQLESEGVQFVFGERVLSAQPDASGFAVETTGATYRARGVVSTIPLDQLYTAIFGEHTALQFLDMTTLYVSAASLHPDTGNVLFNFHKRGLWKRATIYSRLYPQAPTDREFFGVEVTIPAGGQHEPDKAFADFCDHLTELGIADDLKLEGSEHLKAVYPLISRDSAEIQQGMLNRIKESGIVTVGRQGRFEYLPTSTGVIRRVAEELEKAEEFSQ